MSYAANLDDPSKIQEWLVNFQGQWLLRAADSSIHYQGVFTVTYSIFKVKLPQLSRFRKFAVQTKGDLLDAPGGRTQYDSLAALEAFVLSLPPVLTTDDGDFAIDDDYLYYIKSDVNDPFDFDEGAVLRLEFCFATSDIQANSDPTDTATPVVQWFAGISDNPEIQQSVSDIFDGFSPSHSVSVGIADPDGVWLDIASRINFYGRPVKIHHLAGENTPSNFKLVYTGLIHNISLTDVRASISIAEANLEFERQAREEVSTTTGQATRYEHTPNVAVGTVLQRLVFGINDGHVPVCTDFNDTAPTTANNRTWYATQDAAADDFGVAASVSKTVVGGSSTTTRTFLNSAQGITVGDRLWFDRAVGTDEYPTITAVNYVSNYVDHAALSGGAMTSGDTVKRGRIGFVQIVQDGVSYFAIYDRDFTETVNGFTFKSTMEATVGLPATYSPKDRVTCRIYGNTNAVVVSGNAIGANDAETGNLTNPVSIIAWLMQFAGIKDADIDSSFDTVADLVTDRISFVHPVSYNGDDRTVKEIIGEILQESSLRLFKNRDQKWELQIVDQMGAEAYTVEDSDIVGGTIDFANGIFDFATTATVRYGINEVSPHASAITGDRASFATSDIQAAIFETQASKTYKVDSHHFTAALALQYANRLAAYYGTRQGRATLSLRHGFLSLDIGDVLKIRRTRLPGFRYDGETLFEKKYRVIGLKRRLGQINLELDDQEAVEQNTTLW